MRELFVLLAYLLGSVSFSIVVVRLIARKDIRQEGSGNAGATNVVRNHGWKAGLIVGFLDVAKGAAAVLAMLAITGDPRYLAAASFAVVLGHVFPVFFRFRGGKGVATTVGAFLVLAPGATAVVMGLFAVVSRRVRARLDPRHHRPARRAAPFHPRAVVPPRAPSPPGAFNTSTI